MADISLVGSCTASGATAADLHMIIPLSGEVRASSEAGGIIDYGFESGEFDPWTFYLQDANDHATIVTDPALAYEGDRFVLLQSASDSSHGSCQAAMVLRLDMDEVLAVRFYLNTYDTSEADGGYWNYYVSLSYEDAFDPETEDAFYYELAWDHTPTSGWQQINIQEYLGERLYHAFSGYHYLTIRATTWYLPGVGINGRVNARVDKVEILRRQSLTVDYALQGSVSATSSAVADLHGAEQPVAGSMASTSSAAAALSRDPLIIGAALAATTGAAGVLDRQMPLSGAATGASSVTAPRLGAYLSSLNQKLISFSSGSTAPTVGGTLTGGTTGATGIVASYYLTSGSWAGGDAAGSVVLEQDVIGEYVVGEALTELGEGAVVTAEMESLGLPIVEWNVGKGIDDAYWVASITVDGLFSAAEIAEYQDILLEAVDYAGVTRQCFFGFVPDSGLSQNAREDTTTLTAYSHAWYMVNQSIPSALRHTATYDGGLDKVTYLEPSVVVRDLVGGDGTSSGLLVWEDTSGCYPAQMAAVTGWGSTIPKRGWAWDHRASRWQAIMEICDYVDYLFDVIYNHTTGAPEACFYPLSRVGDMTAVDTTFGGPSNLYVESIGIDRQGSMKFTRAVGKGPRNYHSLKFSAGEVELVAGQTLQQTSDNAEATIISVTLDSGAWATNDAAGTIVISYDRTGDFQTGQQIIDKRGPSYGEALTASENTPYEEYDIYEYAYPVTPPARAREIPLDIPEGKDSTALIEAYVQDLYTFYNMDNTTYTAVLVDRPDIKLWQRVLFTGYPQIPEEWMRVIRIEYRHDKGGDFHTTITLQDADYVSTQRRLRDTNRYSNVGEIEKIIDDMLTRHLKVKTGTIKKITGKYFDVELKDGSSIVKSHGVTN